MKPIRHFLTAIPLLLLSAAALAADRSPYPAWQMVIIEPGVPRAVRIAATESLSANRLPSVELSGAELTHVGFNLLANEIELQLKGQPGDSVSFDSVLLDYGSGQQELTVGPVRVLWLKPHPGMPLQTRVVQTMSDPEVTAFVLHNTGTQTLELTDLIYAPPEVATGQLFIRENVAPVTSFNEPDLSWFSVESGQEATAEAAFEQFSFTERTVILEPDAQVQIALTGDGFVQPELFHHSNVLEFAPVVAFREGGVDWHLLLYRNTYPVPGE